MPIPSPTEATQHLARVTAEIARLREGFSMRPKPEKQRMGALERLAPKLHRLAKRLAVARVTDNKADALSDAEAKLLATLTPPKA